MTNQTQTRDSFIFYRSFYQAIKKLPPKDKAEIFDAICSYALDGDKIEMGVVPEAIFTVIKPNLDANRRKWQNGCKEKQKKTEVEAEAEQTISKIEAKDKQNESKPEGNVDKDKDVDVDGNENKKKDVDKNEIMLIENNFNEFWNFYTPVAGKDGRITPKGNKADAKKAYQKAIQQGFTKETILIALESYLKDCQKNARYTKHASTWLNESLRDNFEVEDVFAIQPLQTQTNNGKSGAMDSFFEILNNMENGGKIDG